MMDRRRTIGQQLLGDKHQHSLDISLGKEKGQKVVTRLLHTRHRESIHKSLTALTSIGNERAEQNAKKHLSFTSICILELVVISKQSKILQKYVRLSL